MGLFINNSEHPDVFMNSGEILEPNQGYFKIDYFSEMIKEQKKINNALSSSFHELKSLNLQQNNTQSSQWKEIGMQLDTLKESNFQHEEFESRAMEWLTTLDRNNRKLQSILENGGLLNQEIIDQVNTLDRSNRDIVNELGKYESSSQQLALQMKELSEFTKRISDQISTQDDNQDKVLIRLDNQEALMEKTLRQIDHFRTVLFERTNHLAEKIESSYDLTSSFVYKLLTGSDQPVTMYMRDQKKVESQIKSD